MAAGKQLARPRLIKGHGASNKVYIVTHGLELEGLPLNPTRKYTATDDFQNVCAELGLMVGETSALAVKLGSIASHVDEMLGEGGHRLDEEAIKGLLADPEVKAWLADLEAHGLLPVKR